MSRAAVIAPAKHAAPRARTGPPRERPPARSETETSDGNTAADALAADVLASAFGTVALPVRPRAQRRSLLAVHEREDARAPEPLLQKASASADTGTGLGRNGGPGGEGRGRGGLVGERFAFGGPSGAFRADVCFIEPWTKSLKEIKRCPPQVTFFSDVLDISPRRFNEGFPGVSERTEWFAIQYRGKFQIESADQYTFRLLSDDGAILKIDGYLIIDNDGQHLPRSKQMTITLDAGEHDFSLFYYQGPADFIALQLFVTRFGTGERLFGPRF